MVELGIGWESHSYWETVGISPLLVSEPELTIIAPSAV